MGVNLAPLVESEEISLDDLENKFHAVDANNILHQFLATIRKKDGSLLADSNGNITSHLVGLLYRSTRLLDEYEVPLVFVFDGEMPDLKEGEMRERMERRMKASREWRRMKVTGDLLAARRRAIRAGRLTSPMLRDVEKLLGLLGIPWIQAPGEAEAQRAFMSRRGDVWATNNRDYDSLLFGSPRLVRYLTVSAKPPPELIRLQRLLSNHCITRKQLVDMGILIGTDYNEGVRGVGPKTSLKLVKKHKRLEDLPKKIREKVTPHYEDIRKLYLEPGVTSHYSVQYRGFNEGDLYDFLCDQRGFPRKRVKTAVERMVRFHSSHKQDRVREA